MFDNLLLNSLLYFFLTFLCFFGWSVFLIYRRGISVGDAIAGAFILGLSQIILSEYLLGLLLDRLFVPELSLLNMTISLTILWSVRKGLAKSIKRITITPRAFLNRIRSSIKIRSFPNLIVPLIGVMILLNLLFLIVLWPPTSWDDYHYHIGFIVDVIQSGEIRVFLHTHDYTISFPHNIELFALWNVIFIARDYLVELANLYFLLYGMLIAYLYANWLKLSNLWKINAAFALLAVPINILLIKTTKVDLPIGMLFIGALYFLARARFLKNVSDKQQLTYLILSSVSMGIIFGSKSSSMLYLVLYATLLILLYISRDKNDIKAFIRAASHSLTLLFFSTLIFGAFWYIRSWIVFGNPLYPLSLNIFGVELPGYWKELAFDANVPQVQHLGTLDRLFYIWKEKDSWSQFFYIADGKLTGFGPIWFILMLPSYIITLIYSIYKKFWSLIILLAAPMVLFLIIPGNWITHYTTFITVTGAIAFAFIGSRLIHSRLSQSILHILFILLLSINAISTYDSSFYQWDSSYERISDIKDGTFVTTTQKYLKANELVNKYLDSGEIVLAGDNVYFPHALIKYDLSTYIRVLPHSAEVSWLEELRELDPVLIAVMHDSEELYSVITNSEEFQYVLSEYDGPMYLFANRNNPHVINSSQVIYNSPIDNNDPQKLGPESVEVSEVFGQGAIKVLYDIDDIEYDVDNLQLRIILQDSTGIDIPYQYSVIADRDDTGEIYALGELWTDEMRPECPCTITLYLEDPSQQRILNEYIFNITNNE